MELILILIVVAAIAGLLGFRRISGLALTGAALIAGIIVVLVLLGILLLVALA